MTLHPIPIADIPFDRPLRYSIFDQAGNLIFSLGDRLKGKVTPEELANLAQNGLFRDLDTIQGTSALTRDEIGGHTSPKSAENTSFPPAGIQPQPWERVQVRLVGREGRYNAHLIGYIKNVSILITAPLVRGQPLIVRDGELLEIRMLLGNVIHVFESLVSRICIDPVHYLHLAYPRDVKHQTLRKAPWAKVVIGVSIATAGSENEVGRIINLSTGGAQVEMPRSLCREGTRVTLNFTVTVDEITRQVSIPALIRKVHKLKPGTSSLIECGVEFNELPDDVLVWLKCLVYERIAEGYLA